MSSELWNALAAEMPLGSGVLKYKLQEKKLKNLHVSKLRLAYIQTRSVVLDYSRELLLPFSVLH